MKVGDKFVKDGEVVEVVSSFHFTLKDEHKRNDGIDLFSDYTVWFLFSSGEISVLTERDFLEQYKPYEPICEYQYALFLNGKPSITYFYFTDQEAKGLAEKRQRLDFTKRERVQ